MSLYLRGSRNTGEEASGKTPDQMPTQLQKSRPAKWRRPQRQARARGHDSAGERMAPRMMTEYCDRGLHSGRGRQVGRADGLAPVGDRNGDVISGVEEPGVEESDAQRDVAS